MEELCKDCSPSLPWKASLVRNLLYQVLVSSEGSRVHHSSEGTFWPNLHWKNCQTDPPITQLAATEALLHRAMRRCYDNRNGRLVKGFIERDNEQSRLGEEAGINGSC